MGRSLSTAKQVENIKEPGVYSIADAPNLYLQVQESRARGARPGDVTKAWLLRFQVNGVAHYMGGGKAGPKGSRTLKDATDWAYKQRLLLADRINPIEHRDAKERERIAAEAKSKLFPTCVDEFIDLRRAKWSNKKHAAQWRATLAIPGWSKKFVSTITKDDVLEVLRPIWQKKTTTAARLRGRIEKVLSWAIGKKYREGPNPATWKDNLEHDLQAPSDLIQIEHHAALPYKEIGTFMKELRDQEGDAARALELIILTCTRTSEAIGAKKKEIDFEAKSWTIPAERMKGAKGKRRAHRVPLTARAIEILRQLFKDHPDSEYVFPSRDDKPLSNMACLKLLERMGRDDITTHGFRSTFRDWTGEETTFPRDVAEMALAHRVAGKTEESYWRGDLYEKRRRLMEAWAAYCEKTQRAASVSSIEEKRAAAAS